MLKKDLYCPKEISEEELEKDIVAIIHSFSGKLYGLSRKVKEELLKELDVDG